MMSNFTTTDPGCPHNEIWDKTGYNSARVENIAVPLRLVGSIRWWAIKWCETNSTTTNPVAMATKFKTKVAYNSSCIRYISEMLASNRKFSGTGYPMMSVKF